MVECEFGNVSNSVYKTLVLIDTWWNVNFVNSLIFPVNQSVLIDTWWNVN